MTKKENSTLSYPVLSANGTDAGSFELSAAVFGTLICKPIVFETVIWQQAKRRAGTHSVITKGVMRGGNKKPWRQKGTGRARAGSNTSPIWVGGAVAHGPKPHGYETRVPKRTRRQGLTSVLSDKASARLLCIVDSYPTTDKAKDFVAMLKKLGIAGQKIALLVTAGDQSSESRWKVARNIPGVVPMPVDALSAYELLRTKYILGSKEDFASLQQTIESRERAATSAA